MITIIRHYESRYGELYNAPSVVRNLYRSHLQENSRLLMDRAFATLDVELGSRWESLIPLHPASAERVIANGPESSLLLAFSSVLEVCSFWEQNPDASQDDLQDWYLRFEKGKERLEQALDAFPYKVAGY